MKQTGKIYFLCGTLCAFLCVACFSGNGTFASLFAQNDNIGSLPRELRLSVEAGLISIRQARSKDLDKNVSAKTFAEKAAYVMKLLGHPEPTVDYLRKSNIMKSTRRNVRLTRQEAFEIMSRLCEDFTEYFSMNYPGGTSMNYSDYKIPEFCVEPAAYLQSRFIITPKTKDLLGAKDKLSNRECIYWLYRLYEAVSADQTALSNPDLTISFVDLPKNHPMLPVIENLLSNGAFDRLILKSSFDGDSFITKQEMAEIILGITSRAKVGSDEKFDEIFGETINGVYATRSDLAIAAEYLLDTLTNNKTVQININYKDVSEKDKEYTALRKIAGSCRILLGYGDSNLRGNENISWFETSNVFNAAVMFSKRVAFHEKMTHKSEYKSVFVGSPDEEPTRKEIQDFIAVLQEKRDKIRKILGPGKRPSGKIY